MNQLAEAIKNEVPVRATNAELVNLFLSGSNGSSDTYHVLDNILYDGNRIIGRMANNGAVLLPNTTIDDVEFNDTLIGTIFSQGRKMTRLTDFSNLTSSVERLKEVDNGKFDQFGAVASLFNFEYTPAEVASIELAKNFRERIKTHFDKVRAEETERVRLAEEKAAAERAIKEKAEREARIAKTAILWDQGKGNAANSDIKGAGGGQRLRASLAKDRYPKFETSTGYSATIGQAKRAFDFASKHWHGTQEMPGWRGSARINIPSGNCNSRRVEVTAAALHFGCQHVTRAEAERFADVMGWARATKQGI